VQLEGGIRAVERFVTCELDDSTGCLVVFQLQQDSDEDRKELRPPILERVKVLSPVFTALKSLCWTNDIDQQRVLMFDIVRTNTAFAERAVTATGCYPQFAELFRDVSGQLNAFIDEILAVFRTVSSEQLADGKTFGGIVEKEAKWRPFKGVIFAVYKRMMREKGMIEKSEQMLRRCITEHVASISLQELLQKMGFKY
jgi:hypothetical protein